MPQNKKRLLLFPLLVAMLAIAALLVYYCLPSARIPEGVIIDHIVVYKSRHELHAFSRDKLIVTYRIATGRNPGAKNYEDDQKTPEGVYRIHARNAHSGYHKNLGISYPNEADRARARTLGKSPGGDIKIHGLKNGMSYIGKFHRWTDWTNGCIALADEEVDELYEHVPLGTVIEIRK